MTWDPPVSPVAIFEKEPVRDSFKRCETTVGRLFTDDGKSQRAFFWALSPRGVTKKTSPNIQSLDRRIDLLPFCVFSTTKTNQPIPQKNNTMILGAMMRVLHSVLGISILTCPSTNGLVASPLLRVPFGLHMTIRSADALYMRQKKALPPRTNPFKRITKRNMSDVVSTSEDENNKGFWGTVS
jgi:hypothetical protein